jgi:hypothetical protein
MKESSTTAARSSEAEPASLPWWRRLGRRNILYVLFVALLIPASIWLESTGPGGPDSGGGLMAGFMLWSLVSFGFFVVNAILLIVALVQNRPLAKPFIACILPVAVVLGTLAFEELTVP